MAWHVCKCKIYAVYWIEMNYLNFPFLSCGWAETKYKLFAYSNSF